MQIWQLCSEGLHCHYFTYAAPNSEKLGGSWSPRVIRLALESCVVSIRTTSFNIKFLHFASIVRGAADK